jgi:hypothetical protein
MISVNKLPYLASSILFLSLSSCDNDVPHASFRVDLDTENKPLYAVFTSTSENAESVVWTIEGNQVTSPVLEYTFDRADTYTVELRITNEDGEFDRIEQKVEIPFVDPCSDHWKAKDQEVLDQHFAQNNITPLRNDELELQYVIIEPGDEERITDDPRQRVKIRTSELHLDGTLGYTSSKEPRYEEYGGFRPEIIAVLRLVGNGGKVHYFYNTCRGLGTTAYWGIPPYTPRIYQVEVIDL